MQRAIVCVFSVLLVLAGLTGPAAAKRVALVIGNSNYAHIGKLPNPVNDSADIAASLTRLGFTVTRKDNLRFDTMRRALRAFSREASSAEMAVVFFAGHGIEVNKHNYLIPVDARLETDQDVSYEALPLDHVTEAVSGARGLKLVILDACRNNPFIASMKMTNPTRSIGRGLARVEPVSGTLVAFAAKEGTIAADGDDRNSPYTKALLSHLEQPGLEIQFLFRKVRDSVMKQTGSRQQPFTYGSLPGHEIFLKGPKAGASTGTSDETARLQEELDDLRQRLKDAERRQKQTDSAAPLKSGNRHFRKFIDAYKAERFPEASVYLIEAIKSGNVEALDYFISRKDSLSKEFRIVLQRRIDNMGLLDKIAREKSDVGSQSGYLGRINGYFNATSIAALRSLLGETRY